MTFIHIFYLVILFLCLLNFLLYLFFLFIIWLFIIFLVNNDQNHFDGNKIEDSNHQQKYEQFDPHRIRLHHALMSRWYGHHLLRKRVLVATVDELQEVLVCSLALELVGSVAAQQNEAGVALD